MTRLPPGFSRPVLVGEGAFGKVFRAREDGSGRWVALKRLESKGAARAEAAVLALGLPCLPALHSVVPFRGSDWIAMELVGGVPLDALRRMDPDTEEIEPVATALVEAMAALHRRGIGHGDLKPGHVRVEASGRVRLLDLGLTGPAATGGTAGYAAPEAGATDSDILRCDLWSLGRMLHELLAGALPTQADRANRWARLDAAAPGWSPLVELLLREDPSQRPASAAELVLPAPARAWSNSLGERIAAAADRDLASRLASAAAELLKRGSPAAAVPLLQESLDLDPDQGDALALLGRVRIRPPTRRWPWVAAAALVAASAAAWLALRTDAPSPTIPSRLDRDRVRTPRGGADAPPVPLREGAHR